MSAAGEPHRIPTLAAKMLAFIFGLAGLLMLAPAYFLLPDGFSGMIGSWVANIGLSALLLSVPIALVAVGVFWWHMRRSALLFAAAAFAYVIPIVLLQVYVNGNRWEGFLDRPIGVFSTFPLIALLIASYVALRVGDEH